MKVGGGMDINKEQVINKLAGELAAKSKELAYFKVATEQLENDLTAAKSEIQELKEKHKAEGDEK